MRRILLLLAGFAPAAVTAQGSTGTELWRLAATTLPLPPALATGGTGAFWNPAQPAAGERASFALDVIQTASMVGASGMLAAGRVLVQPLGRVGLVYGRMGIGDLVRTSLSPDPEPGGIPCYTQSVGLHWSAAARRTTLGATLAYHDTRLDIQSSNRWTFDVGVRRAFGDALTVAAATHFFSHVATDEPAQDVYGGIELRMWHGPLWGSRGALHGRYGISTAHGFTADHVLGAGLELGNQVASDLAVAREGSFGDAGWRVVAGVRVALGRYRVSLARHAGLNDVGPAYRVGLEGRLP
jgi:hypothetical protein